MKITSAENRRRLARVEAAAVAAENDLRTAVLAARQSPPSPTHTRQELQALAQGDDMVARIARGWLRIAFVAGKSQGNPEIAPDVVLPQMAGYFYTRPLEFCLFTFDFGNDPSLRLVRLPEPWGLVYASEFGVEKWVCEFFEEVARQVVERAFDGTRAVEAIRMATVSGHGISKSATTAMLVNWIMSTRPNARGVVTANTAPQLESKTWAEIAKWHRRSLFSGWFDVTTGRGSMKMTSVNWPESWNCFGQTAAEERAESFAGLHAADSTPFYIFDESSAIPAAIWEVAEGGLTDGEPHIYCFGNPTRNNTKFFDCFHSARHRWTTRKIDSRTCQLTNKTTLQEWIDDYGLSSDFVKVRVLGEFPSASSLQFIARDIVEDAMEREVGEQRHETAVCGIDVARFGDDESVIFTRLGRDARCFPVKRYRQLDTMALASRVAEHVNWLRSLNLSVVCFIDSGGVGGGVADRLRQLGHDVIDINFGARASEPTKWANKRAEMWCLMRDWIRDHGALPQDDQLMSDLTGLEYGFDGQERILLEKKQDMKRRGLASPDIADAFALTFAQPVAAGPSRDEILWDEYRARQRTERQDFDPITRMHNDVKAGRQYDPMAGRR